MTNALLSPLSTSLASMQLSLSSLSLHTGTNLSHLQFEGPNQLLNLLRRYEMAVLINTLSPQFLENCLDASILKFLSQQKFEDFSWCCLLKLYQPSHPDFAKLACNIAALTKETSNKSLFLKIVQIVPSILSDLFYLENRYIDQSTLTHILEHLSLNASYVRDIIVTLCIVDLSNEATALISVLEKTPLTEQPTWWRHQKNQTHIYFALLHSMGRKHDLSAAIEIVKKCPYVLQATVEDFDDDEFDENFFDSHYFTSASTSALIQEVPYAENYFFDILCNLLKAGEYEVFESLFSALEALPETEHPDWWKNSSNCTSLFFIATESEYAIPSVASFYQRIDQTQVNEYGQPPLSAAAKKNLKKAVRALLHEGKINHNLVDRYHKSATDYICENFSERTLASFISRLDITHLSIYDLVCSCLKTNKLATARTLIATAARTNSATYNWWNDLTLKTSLFCFGLNKGLQISELFIEPSALNPHFIDNSGKTALTYIAELKNKKFTEALLLKGARLYHAADAIRTNFEETFLTDICEQLKNSVAAAPYYLYFLFDSKKHTEASALLAGLRHAEENKQPIWWRTRSIRSSLFAAAVATGAIKEAFLLIEDNIDPNFLIDGQKPLLICTVEHKSLPLATALLKKGAQYTTRYCGTLIEEQLYWTFGEDVAKAFTKTAQEYPTEQKS